MVGAIDRGEKVPGWPTTPSPFRSPGPLQANSLAAGLRLVLGVFAGLVLLLRLTSSARAGYLSGGTRHRLFPSFSSLLLSPPLPSLSVRPLLLYVSILPLRD